MHTSGHYAFELRTFAEKKPWRIAFFFRAAEMFESEENGVLIQINARS